jgi:hypothetical protein
MMDDNNISSLIEKKRTEAVRGNKGRRNNLTARPVSEKKTIHSPKTLSKCLDLLEIKEHSENALFRCLETKAKDGV